MADSQGSWSFDNENKQAIYSIGTTSVATITGLESSTGLGDLSGNVFTIDASALSGLSNGTTVSLTSENYYFSLASGLKTAAEIDSTSLKFETITGGGASIQGKYQDYYTLDDDKVVITVHTDSDAGRGTATTRTFASISGISTSAGLTFLNSASKVVALDTSDLTSQDVSLSLASDAATKAYGFQLKLVGKQNGNDSDSVDYLGLSTGANIWQIGSDSTSASYMTTKTEGWTLSQDGMGVSYAGESHTPIVSISGFGSTLSTSTEDGTGQQKLYYNNGSSIEAVTVSTSGSSVVFGVKTGALSASAATTLTLTTGAGASQGYTYQFAFNEPSSVGTDKDGLSIYGLSSHENQAYWSVIDGGSTSVALYQYGVDDGWRIDSTGQNISYSAAVVKDLAKITGVSDGTTTTNSGGLSVINGIDVATTAGSSIRTIKINDTSLFGFTASASSATLEDADTSDDIGFTFALSSAIATSAAYSSEGSSTAQIANGASIAYITNIVEPYYTLSSVSNGSVLSYSDSAIATVATVTGLSDGASVSIIGEGSASSVVLVLDSTDLTNTNVSLSWATNITGLPTYSLSFQGGSAGDHAVTSQSGVIDVTSVSATLVSNVAYGMAEAYYTLNSVSNATAVTYHASESMAIAQINGLSTTAVLGQNFSMSSDGKTVMLSQSALGDGDLSFSTLNGVKTHGLSFQFKTDADGVSTQLGFSSTADYWMLDDTNNKASYGNNIEKGWKINSSGKNIFYTPATAQSAFFTIEGIASDAVLNGSASQIGTKAKNGTFISGISIGTHNNNGTYVTIGQALLTTDSTKPVTVKATEYAPTGGYSFLLEGDVGGGWSTTDSMVSDETANDGIVGMVSGLSHGRAYWSVDASTGKAIYQYDTTAGWKYDSSTGKITYAAAKTTTLATIDGLEGYATITSDSGVVGISGITVSGTSILLGKEVLGTKEISITSGTEETYTLSLSTAGDSTAGFGPSSNIWRIVDGKAVYTARTEEGWTLGKDGKITYTPQSGTYYELATITGFKSGITEEILNANLTDPAYSGASTGIITLSKAVLNETAGTTVTLTNAAGYSYTLALDGTSAAGSSISNITGLSTVTGLSYVAPTGRNDKTATITVQETLQAGWSFASGSTSLTYHAAVDKTHATITGLNLGTISQATDIAGSISFANGSTIISLSNAALSTMGDVELKNADSYSYKLALTDDKGNTPLDGTNAGDGKVGFTGLSYKWDYDNIAGTVGYYTQTEEGWELGADSTTITYKTSDSTKTTLATINGLKKNENYLAGISTSVTGISDANNIYMASESSKYIAISTNLVGADSDVSLSQEAKAAGYGLSLLEDLKSVSSTEDSTSQGDGKVGFFEGMPAFDDFKGQTTAELKQSIGEGWTLKDDGSITYTAATTLDLAKITGLSSGAYNAVGLSFATTGSVSDYNKITITLGASALGTEEIKLDRGKDAADDIYYFSLSGASAGTGGTEILGFNGISETWKANGDGTFSYYNAGKEEGWTLNKDGNSVTYTAATPTALVTIKGLSSGLSAADLNGGISVTERIGTTLGTILINNPNILGKAEISLTAGSDNFNLKLKEADTWKSQLDTAGTSVVIGGVSYAVTDGYYWILQDGTNADTATYYASMKEGWALDESGKKISYTAAKQTEVFKITGLSAGVSAATTLGDIPVIGGSAIISGTISQISGQSTVLSLSTAALTSNNVKLSVGDGYSYTLAIQGESDGILGGEIDKRYWTLQGTTAYYKQDLQAGWTLNTKADEITYSAPENNKELAKITGLVNGITTTTASVSYAGGDSAPISTIVGITVEGESNASRTYVNPVAAAGGKTEDPVEIMLSAGVLGNSEVKISTTAGGVSQGRFVLVLGPDVAQEAEASANYWTVKNTTATYQKDNAAYYELDKSEEKITYHGASSTTLAKIVNIKSGTKAVADKSDMPAAIEGITVVQDANGSNKGKMLISDEVLGTNAKNNFKLSEGSYTIAIDDDVNTNSKTEGTYWTYGATTTLKKYNKAYYTLSGNEIVYHAQVDSKNSNNKAIVPLTITGLNKEVGDDDIIFFDSVYGESKYVEGTTYTQQEWANLLSGLSAATTGNSAASVADFAGTVILTADALNNANVTLTNGKDEKGNAYTYKLALMPTTGISGYSSVGVAAPTPTSETAKWTINKTTATLKGNAQAGYTVSADGKKITYTKAQKASTLLTISGLPTGMGLSSSVSDYKTKIEGVTIAADGSITFGDDILDNNLDSDTKNNFTKISVKGTGYTIASLSANAGHSAATYYTAGLSTMIYTSKDPIVSGKDADDKDITGGAGVDVWRISGTTATYKRIIPAHYEIQNGALVFVKEKNAKVKNANGKLVDAIYFTITGFKKDTLAEGKNGKMLVLKGTSKEAVTINGNKLTVNAGLLDDKNTKIQLNNKLYKATDTANAYTFDFTNTTTSETVWKISGTTATLKSGKTGGWEINAAKNILTKKGVTQDAKATAVLQIKGLKSGTTVKTDGSIDGVSISGNVVTLDSKVLGAGTVSVNNGYTIETNANTSDSDSNKNYTYSVSGTTVTIKSNDGVLPYYVKNDNQNKLTYKKVKQGTTVVAKIKNLKSGLKVQPDGSIDGISFNGSTVTVGASALGKGTKAVTVEGSGVSLAVDDTDMPVITSVPTYTWKIKNTTATLYKGSEAYYEEKDGTIVYHKATTGDAVAEISNLKKGLKVQKDASGQTYIDGITLNSSTGEITLSAAALSDDTIELTNKKNSSYYLALATDAETAKHTQTSGAGQIWSVSGTTATLYEAKTAGYVKPTGTSTTKLEYKDTLTSESNILATVSHLKSGLRVNTDGTIDGISVNGKQISIDSRALGTDASNAVTVDHDYKLHLVTKDEDATNGADSGELINKCTVSKTTVTITPTQNKGYIEESDTIKYVAAKPYDAIATLEGVKSGLKVDSNGQIDGISFSKNSNTTKGTVITLDSKVLGTGTVKAKLGIDENSKDATIAFSEEDPSVTKYYVKDGALIIKTTALKGYSKEAGTGDDAGKQIITYSAGDTVTTTITGLNTSKVANITDSTTGLATLVNDKISVGTDGTVTIKTTDAIGSDKVTITGGKYKLALDTSTNDAFKDKTGTLSWNYVGSTATLTEEIQEDNYTCDGVTITKNSTDKAKYKILATITGLRKGLTVVENTNTHELTATSLNGEPITGSGRVLSLDTTTGKITLGAWAYSNSTNTNIKLTGTGYTLDATNKAGEKEDPSWHLNGTTATYAPTKSTGGLKISEDGKSATYKKEVLGTTLAKITGLSSGINETYFADDPGSYIAGASYGSGDTITFSLSSAVLDPKTASIKLTDSDPDKEFKLTLAAGVATVGANKGLAWTVSGGSAIYSSLSGAYYTVYNKGMEVSLSPATFSTVQSAVISGLKSNIKADDEGNIAGISVSSNNISLGADVLSTSEAVLTGANTSYQLFLGKDANAPTAGASFLTLSSANGNATVKYMQEVSGGYSVASTKKSISYIAPKTGNDANTLFEIQGLNGGLKLENGTIDGVNVGTSTTVTIAASALGTVGASVTSGNYTLALNSDVATSSANTIDWVVNGTTATLSNVRPAYYALTNSNKSITYTAESVGTGLATLTGVSDLDSKINGLSTVTLYDNNLSKSTPVTFTTTNSSTYKLLLGGDVAVQEKSTYWSKKSNTSVAKIITSAGYSTASSIVSGTNATISYAYADEKTKDVATVIGANGALNDDYINIAAKEVSLTGSQLSNKITISGGNDSVAANNYKFNFMYYNNAAVTGSDGADYVTFDGSSLKVSFEAGGDSITFTGTGGKNTITGGKGDDSITLANSRTAGDVIIYNSDDGNDVIKNFDVIKDKIQIAGAALASTAVTQSGGDALVNVSSGNTIKLIGVGSQYKNLKIFDNTGENIMEKSAADLLYDEEDNFFTGDEDAQLSYITNTSFHAHSSNEFDDPQDLTKLTKQSSLIFYGKDKK